MTFLDVPTKYFDTDSRCEIEARKSPPAAEKLEDTSAFLSKFCHVCFHSLVKVLLIYLRRLVRPNFFLSFFLPFFVTFFLSFSLSLWFFNFFVLCTLFIFFFLCLFLSIYLPSQFRLILIIDHCIWDKLACTQYPLGCIAQIDWKLVIYYSPLR